LSTLPNGPESWRQELPLQIALGVALTASKGYAAPETGRAYVRAQALCEQLGDGSTLASVLSGQSTFHLVRGEYVAARESAETLLQLAEEQHDTTAVLLGHSAMGLGLHYLAEFTSSKHHLERVLEIYVPETHRLPPGAAAVDVKVRSLTFLSHNLFMLGYLDQALARSEQAVLWSRTLLHSHSLAYALSHAAALHLFCCDEKAAYVALEEAAAIATQHGFPLWLAYLEIMRGHILAVRGQGTKGLALARKGHADMKATGALIVETWCLSLCAKCFEQAGQPDEALNLLINAFESVERMNERFFEAELHRLKGEWLLAHRPAELIEAESCFERALAVGRKQKAKVWQLRAATSLALLWQHQGKREQARELLAPIYSWFTEGTDTPILEAASTVLRELAGR
jgi:predicted ATPase